MTSAVNHPMRRPLVLVIVLHVFILPSISYATGDLILADWRSHRLVRMNGDTGAFIGFMPSAGLGTPQDMLLGPDGLLYVTSAGNGTSNGSIRRYDPQTGAAMGFISVPGDPLGIVLGPDGNLYVGSDGATTSSVYEIDPTSGQILSTFATAAPSVLRTPMDLAFGSDGKLYVSSFNTNAVLRFDGQSGAFVDVFATSTGPVGMLPDGAGGMYVTSYPGANQSGVLNHYASDGSLIRWAYAAEFPGRMVYGPHDLIYVSSYRYAGIQRVDPATWTWGYDWAPGGTQGASSLLFLPEPVSFGSALFAFAALIHVRRPRR